MRKKRLGEILKANGRITESDLQAVIAQRRGKALLLGELLLSRGLVSREELASALQEVTRAKYFNCRSVAIDPAVLELVPSSIAIRHTAMPISFENGKLVVVMAEPQNLLALDELRFTSGREILPLLGFRDEIADAIARHYVESTASFLGMSAGTDDSSKIEFFTTSSRESNREALKEFQADLRHQRTPAVRLVSHLICAAAAKRASDIHIDPHVKRSKIRLRVDGVLQELMDVPQELQASLISRIKILADLDIAERRIPQDGRILVRIGARQLDLRIATLPLRYGEKVVIRLLNPGSADAEFSDLGFSGEASATLVKILSQPQGMLLVTGPTGSGKTTTLYAALKQLRSRALNIITIEDPIEYMLEGVNQAQVDVKAGRTFAACLRSVLRQDPNVIMVGEIRDGETAEVALTAAQTGHLVLTTLHTNDSVSALTRLADLNVAPYLIASSVSAIAAQRLLRKLCTCCNEGYVTADYEERLRASGIEDFGKKMYYPVGCPTCDGLGYLGRFGVYEILIVNDQICAAIRAGANADEFRAIARSAGMRTMQDEALEGARKGLTSLDEVFRVVHLEKLSQRCFHCGEELSPRFSLCPYCGEARDEAEPSGRRRAITELRLRETVQR